jgi:hypothetical protein
MNVEIEIAGIKVPKADWDATPPGIQALVSMLSERLNLVLADFVESPERNCKMRLKPLLQPQKHEQIG